MGVTQNCAQCGEPFIRPQSKAGRYCSRKCWHLTRRVQTLESRKCTRCKADKSLSEFDLKYKEAGIVEPYCKDCRRSMNLARSHTTHDRWRKAKNTAKYRSIVWDINEIDYVSIISKPCHYCGGNTGISGSGLDRKNNDLDYDLGNVVPCCAMCNKIKNSHLTYEEMLLLSPILYKVREQRNSDKSEKKE